MKRIQYLVLVALLFALTVGCLSALFFNDQGQNPENGAEEETRPHQPTQSSTPESPALIATAAVVEPDSVQPHEVTSHRALPFQTASSSIAQLCPNLPGDFSRDKPGYLWATLRHLNSLHDTSEQREGPFELPLTDSNTTESSVTELSTEHSKPRFTSVCPMNTSVPLVPFKNRRGKTRMRRYNQTCAQRRAPNNGFPLPKSSYIFYWKRPDGQGAKSTTASAAAGSNTTLLKKRIIRTELPSVAVCLFGQIRRLQQVGRSIFQNIVVNNKADAFAATWPYPDDGGLEREIRSTARDLRNHFHEHLRAVRVELFHPAWKSVDSPFLVNSVYMYFMAEGCLHLMDWAARRESSDPMRARATTAKPHQYQYIIRSRLDLRFDFPITIVLPSAPVKPQSETTSSPKGLHRNTTTAQSTILTAPTEGWKVKLGTLLLNVPASHLLMHDYTLCCVNDWTTIGPVAEMRATFAIYSMVMAAHRCPWNGTKLHPAARWCHGESCFQRSLVLSNIPWVLANLGVSIGDSTTRKNLNKPVCENQSCRYA